MIKTIQYLAEADPSRVLVALDLKAAFQNVSQSHVAEHRTKRCGPCSCFYFFEWFSGTAEHRMHHDSAYTKISANSGVDQGCPLSTCGFSAAIDTVLLSVLADICRLHDPGAKLFAYLDDWHLWIKPQCPLQTFSLITAATRSVNLELQPSKIQVWRASCQDPPFLLSYKTRSHSHSAVGRRRRHLQIHDDDEPSSVALGEQASMEKTTQRFQRFATTLSRPQC